MGKLSEEIKKSDLDELTSMLQALDATLDEKKEDILHDGIHKLLSDLDEQIIKPVETVIEDVVQVVFENTEEIADLSQNTKKHSEPAFAIIESEPVSNVVSAVENEDRPNRQSKLRFSVDSLDAAFFNSLGLQRETFMEALSKAPVKAKDKVSNLLNWFKGGPDISVYTVIAIHHLLDAKTITSNSIKLSLMSYPEKPYPLSTASSQAGQMMAIFPLTGIATKTDNRLSLNPDSPIVKKFIAEYTIDSLAYRKTP
ncbi:hypothetical protein HVX40_24535 (plasmid) [Escherichia coli]|nr:hypothetical protein [Escherichia coli]MBA8354171.1 hypothetical protein [Escherichia coli]